jgi:type III secretory pathway component EscV
MKQAMKKAAQYESKKSLDGAMKFLKGNVSEVVKKKKK